MESSNLMGGEPPKVTVASVMSAFTVDLMIDQGRREEQRRRESDPDLGRKIIDSMGFLFVGPPTEAGVDHS
jgi:hypothetical protein